MNSKRLDRNLKTKEFIYLIAKIIKMENNSIRYFVIKKSPVGTIVLDRDWLKPGDKIYFNNNEIEITSLPKEMSDNSWTYEIKQQVFFNVGDVLYDTIEIKDKLLLLLLRAEIDRRFKQFLVTGECKIPTTTSNPENEEQ